MDRARGRLRPADDTLTKPPHSRGPRRERRHPPGMKRLSCLLLLCVLAFTSAAYAVDPDPDEFTPPGYKFCGWQDYSNGGWAMDWSEDLRGVYLVAFAEGMSCSSARRNIRRMRYTKTPPYRPIRAGYRCRTLTSAHEYSDVRCVRIGGSRKFRLQTGA